MIEFDSTVDLNGREESASLYVALLEQQVLGLTLVNLRQKATIEASRTATGGFALAEEPDFDLEAAIDQAANKVASIQSDSTRPFRRHRV